MSRSIAASSSSPPSELAVPTVAAEVRPLLGNVAIVTGASRGIGAATSVGRG